MNIDADREKMYAVLYLLYTLAYFTAQYPSGVL